jgi:sulfite exporter TauE/SafE
MNLWLIFLTGLTTGGFTCAAMQGGILASTIANQKKVQVKKGFGFDDWGPVTAFLITKLFSHILLGVLLGVLGSAMQPSLNVRLFFQVFAALFMLATAGNLLEIHPIFRYVCFTPPRFVYKLLKKNQASSIIFAPSIFGFLTVLIPCGVTQAMAVIAMGSGSAVSGALIMGSFVLGTMPMFALIGTLTAKFSEIWRRDFLRLAAIALIIMALSSLNGVLQVSDSPYSLQRLGPRLVKLLPPYNQSNTGFTTDPNVKLEKGLQKVTLAVSNSGYTPKYFRVKSGVPVELTLETGGDVYSCATAFTFKAFDIYDLLKPQDSKVHKFTPEKKGIYTFSCSMGMYSGTMEVI